MSVKPDIAPDTRTVAPGNSRRTPAEPYADASDDEEFCEMVALSPTGRCATMCIFGCISIMGCRSSVVRRLSFYPPFPAGYSLQGDQLYIQEVFNAATAGRGFRGTAPAEQQQQRPPPREGQESIQQLLEHNRLPERVQVCHIRRGKKHQLAAVLLWSTAGVPPEYAQESKAKEYALTNRFLIVFSHGNSTDIGHMFGLHYRMCFRCQVNVLAYDYSGYGWSDGKATEAALYKDIKAVYSFAVKELNVPPKNIILYGHSVGSGPCCDFVAKRKQKGLGGVILHSSIASGLRLFIHNIEKAPWFDAFQNAEKLKKVYDVPMLLIHGRLDRQVPFSHSLKLEAACREADARYANLQESPPHRCLLRAPLLSSKADGSPKGPPKRDKEMQKNRVQTWWIPNADHNDVEHRTGDEYYQRISAFLKFCSKWNEQEPATPPNA
ncbi:hypothetical protein, conserved [Eimeria necatrix]|uniref:Serine aminopeptidase S33 domain-containing protein n=1 Tax=Eimeria necatrix TaxID=51315 RepID=U6MP92_9EIME|nr:hypothetical protein, conserved [Eimeria necatrix]CDJ65836.1 hypothetical protein, conserved [Eimeria necatrix]